MAPDAPALRDAVASAAGGSLPPNMETAVRALTMGAHALTREQVVLVVSLVDFAAELAAILSQPIA